MDLKSELENLANRELATKAALYDLTKAIQQGEANLATIQAAKNYLQELLAEDKPAETEETKTTEERTD